MMTGFFDQNRSSIIFNDCFFSFSSFLFFEIIFRYTLMVRNIRSDVASDFNTLVFYHLHCRFRFRKRNILIQISKMIR